MKLRSGYDKRKSAPMEEYRTMTEAEVRALASGERVKFLANDGTARELRITSVKTWVREPDRVEVRVKYGMREYAAFSLEEAKRRLLVKVEEPVMSKEEAVNAKMRQLAEHLRKMSSVCPHCGATDNKQTETGLIFCEVCGGSWYEV